MFLRRVLGGLAAALLLGLPGWGQEGAVKFNVYPPGAKVFVRTATRDALNPLGSSDHLINVSGINFDRGVVEFEFQHDDGQHKPRVVSINRAIQKEKTWPPDGSTIVLEPISTQARLLDLIRYPTALSYSIGIIFSLLGAILAALAWRARQRSNVKKIETRIRDLGGAPSKTHIQDFIPLNELGAGGFGTVTKAVHKDHLFDEDPPFVAIKTILPARMMDIPGQTGESSYIQRFKREARILEQLNHPNIVKLHLYDLSCPEPYIVMDFVKGQSLDKLIRKHPQGLPPEQAIKIIRPVMDAIAQCHAQKPEIVHADIKPENIMVTSGGTPMLMDFGIANKHGEARITKSSEFVGSTGYAAPEATRGEKGPSVDQYAIGALLFEMLTGERANQEDNAIQELMNAQLGRVRMLSEVKPQWGSFAKAIDKMRAFNVADRYSSVEEALQVIRTLKPPAR